MDIIRVILSPHFNEEDFYEETSGILFKKGRKEIAIHQIDIKKERLEGIQNALRMNILLPYDKATLEFVNGNNISNPVVEWLEDSRTEIIAFQNQIVYDDQIPPEDGHIRTVGENGERLFTWEYETSDGVPTGQVRNEQSEIIKEPIDQIEVIGTYEPLIVRSVNNISNKSVDYGTAREELGLQKTIQTTFNDDSRQSLEITWDDGTPNYDGEVESEYTFRGTLKLRAGMENPDNITTTVVITVLSAPEAPPELDPEN